MVSCLHYHFYFIFSLYFLKFNILSVFFLVALFRQNTMVTMRMFILFFVLFVSFGGNGFFQWWLWSEKLEPTEVKEVELEEETSTTWALLIARSKGFHNYRHQVYPMF